MASSSPTMSYLPLSDFCGGLDRAFRELDGRNGVVVGSLSHEVS